jgi:hypothetical protein
MGTVQGLILELILYAIFVSPIFDLEFVFTFADDNYEPKITCTIPEFIKDMEKATLSVNKWLRDLGFVVNQSKT